MNRWNIARILFFSHDERRRDIELDTGRVNIITGDSHTGKSGIAEVIDYVLGSSECHIPGVIRDATSWTGLLWVRDDTQCLVCRRVPGENAAASSEYAITVGRGLALPLGASQLVGKASRTAAMRKLEQLFGIGAVESELFGNVQRAPARISVRHIVPFLLQDDQHIISKINLFRGEEDERRQSIIDTLPYFLGVVNEKSYSDQSHLQRLRAQLDAELKQLEGHRRLTTRDVATSRALVDEARQVGLLPVTASHLSDADLLPALKELMSDDNAPNPFPDDTRLNELYDEERQLEGRLSVVRGRAEEVRRALRAYDGYVHAASEQRARLEAVELVPTGDGADECPLCNQQLPGRVDSVERVRAAFTSLRSELTGVERERPKLDGVLRQLDAVRASTAADLLQVRRSIRALVRESETRRQGFDVAQRQYRVRGRISLFLDASAAVSGPEAPNIARLRSDIAELEERLNPAAKLAELDSVRIRLLDFAREIARKLPLEDRYKGNPIDFNPKTLEVAIATSKRRIDMRDVGSDENYLTLHVAIVLALHRIFAERDRPIPGFILFDQLSRPYYADPLRSSEEEDVIKSTDPEVRSLREYFAAIFDEAAEQGVQVLILEKAFFSDDARYVAATKERWNSGRKLIPKDWPEH